MYASSLLHVQKKGDIHLASPQIRVGGWRSNSWGKKWRCSSSSTI